MFLENKLLLISINFTSKTSHSCLKKGYTMFSRFTFILTALRKKRVKGFCQISPPSFSEASPNLHQIQIQPFCGWPLSPDTSWVTYLQVDISVAKKHIQNPKGLILTLLGSIIISENLPSTIPSPPFIAGIFCVCFSENPRGSWNWLQCATNHPCVCQSCRDLWWHLAISSVPIPNHLSCVRSHEGAWHEFLGKLLWCRYTTVDGRNPAPVEVGSFSHYLRAFYPGGARFPPSTVWLIILGFWYGWLLWYNLYKFLKPEFF